MAGPSTGTSPWKAVVNTLLYLSPGIGPSRPPQLSFSPMGRAGNFHLILPLSSRLAIHTHTHTPATAVLVHDLPTSSPAQFSVAVSKSQFSPWCLIATLRMLGKPLDFSLSQFPSCKMGLFQRAAEQNQ